MVHKGEERGIAMDAGKKILLDLLTGSLRFVVPVYQRRYSWDEVQCRQRMKHTPLPVDMSRLDDTLQTAN